ncbi:MAG TPA: DUF882 domain-containing protein [Polyangiaceae bacterium]|nr:DUF882 domain-containing protein [Polyangiaceae bacterium]
MLKTIAITGLSAMALVVPTAVAFARREPVKPAPIHRKAAEKAATAAPPVELEAEAPPSPFASLPSVRIASLGTGESLSIRLYDEAGNVDPESAGKLDALLVDARDPDHVEQTELDRRTLKLLFRAAYHFNAKQVEVVSAYRKPGRRREGLHGQGRAIDFKLPGVKPAALAAYLRTLPRVGVGVYTHPRTQFVHLDSRDRSFHWLDASPPGRHWRERSLPDSKLAARDASYRENMDWPESCAAYRPVATR